MSSPAQIEANRQNSLKSTGPKTAQGKEKTSRNPITHGCTSRLINDEVRLSEAYQAKLQDFMAEIQPSSPQRVAFLELAVMESFRSVLALEALDDEIAQQKEAARNHWSQTQRLVAQKLMAKIRKNPSTIASELACTLAGCQLLIESWTSLKNASSESGAWDDGQVETALDLLGVQLVHRGLTSKIRPKICEDIKLHQGTLAQSQIDRLEASIESGVAAADEAERLAVLDGSRSLLSPKARRLSGYINTAATRFDRYLAIASGKRDLPPALADAQPEAPEPLPEPQVIEPPQPVARQGINPFHLMADAMVKFDAVARKERLTHKSKRAGQDQILKDHQRLIFEYIALNELSEEQVTAETALFKQRVEKQLLGR